MKYYIKMLGQRTEDARELAYNDYEDTEDAAEQAAEEFDLGCDTETRWPVVFTMVLGSGKEIDVSVEREYSPLFTGRKVMG